MRTYATILTTDDYLPGALALQQSLKKTRARFELLVVLTKHVSTACKEVLERRCLKTLTLDCDFCMTEEACGINRRSCFDNWNHTLSKLLIFELTRYEKIVFLDSDMLVLQNLDHLFDLPHMSAVAADQLTDGHEDWVGLNSGLMVIRPESGLGTAIMANLSAVAATKECFGDQTLLQAHYPDWPHRPELHLDQKYNVFFCSLEAYVKKHGYNLNVNRPDDKTIAVIHFTGPQKPWSLTGKAQLGLALRRSARFDFARAKVLFRYFLLNGRVHEVEHHQKQQALTV
jgi:alpha-N-acetylglucosamine transferase